MSNTVIKVENVSKQYRLGEIGTGSISHDVHRWWSKILGKEDPYLKIGEKNDRTQKGSSDYVWALKNIDFEVKRGEVLGIIGRNGAGKSTLLKILSRTTLPTTGTIKAKGRIASLLEVGTGFHPDLTGRDNIFLNGAILGMTKQEIKNKFDEIVDFAGVEKYIDTPVKRYSSGMYVRLAFGVAAHLEPEILIIDEVLAVGDAEFQKKALGKMKEVSATEGRTVLFVSHQLGSVQSLCSSCLYMNQGEIIKHGNTFDVVNYYLAQGSSTVEIYRNADNFINTISLVDDNRDSKNSFSTNEEITVKLEFNSALSFELLNAEIGIAVLDNYKNKVFTVKNLLSSNDLLNTLVCRIPQNLLTPGNYSFDVALFKGKGSVIEYIKDIIPFSIVDGGTEFSSFEGADYGKIFVTAKWEK